MGPKLVDYLLYEPEESGTLWIKFNQPERMNALVGTAEENGTVAKVGEYMRAGDDDPNIRVIVLTGVAAAFARARTSGHAPRRTSPVRTCPATAARMRDPTPPASISSTGSPTCIATSR